MAIRTSGTKILSSRQSGLRLELLETRCMLAATVGLAARFAMGSDPVCVYTVSQSDADPSDVVGPINSACPNESSSNAEVATSDGDGDGANVIAATGGAGFNCKQVTVDQETVVVYDTGPTQTTTEDNGTVAKLIVGVSDESLEVNTQVVVPTNERPRRSDGPINDGTSIEYLDPTMVWSGAKSQLVDSDDVALGGEPDSAVPSPDRSTLDVDGPTDAPKPSAEELVVNTLACDATTSPGADTGNGTRGLRQMASPRLGRNRLGGRGFEQAIQELVATIDICPEGARESRASTQNSSTTEQVTPIGTPAEYLTIDIAFSGFKGGLFNRPMRLRTRVNR